MAETATTPVAPETLLDALRARGAERFDPVGWRFVEALARRAANHPHAASSPLQRRLEQAVTDFGTRLDRATATAGEVLARGTARFPEAVAELRQYWDAADFAGLRRALARLETRGGNQPLTDLLAHVARQAQDAAGAAHATAGTEVRGELRSLRRFRSTWSRLSADRHLAQAFAQAPENAGPLNSHFLVLQSLRLMRDTAPEYLEQFISYVDALLWLDGADGVRSAAPKAAVRGERDRKRKTTRRKGE